MPSVNRLRDGAIRIVAFLGLWTLIGLLFAGQFHLSSAQFGAPVSWGRAIGFGLADWYVWAVWSIPVIFLSRRFPLDRGHWVMHLPVHLLASACVAVGYPAVRAYVGQLQAAWDGDPRPYYALLAPLLLKTWPLNLLLYWIILSVTHTVLYQRQLRERELRAIDLEKRLATARLQALQMQLNPHFLFNSLNSVAALMHRDVEAADQMLVRLGELLRRTLDGTGTQEVPLDEELDFLGRYLEIERTRFGDRLSMRSEIDPTARKALVPNLVLQPLVENAIKHGIEPRAARGEILLRARVESGELLLEVGDNGRGPTDRTSTREGIGLSNTRARLHQLYGDAQSLEAGAAPGGGFLVRVRLPLHFTSADSGHPSTRPFAYSP